MKKKVPIVIMIASDSELQCLIKKMSRAQHEVHAGTVFFTGALQGRDVVMVRTGVGAKKAGAASRHMLQRYAPASALITGFAGAIDPVLSFGDIVIVERVLTRRGDMIPCPALIQKRAFGILTEARFPVSLGTCLGVNRFIHKKSEKQLLFERFGARVVDMESDTLCQQLASAEVPVLNVRIVSDTAREDTADLETLYSQKQKKGSLGIGKHFLQHPAEFVKTVRLFRDIRKASVVIADVVTQLIEHCCWC